MQLLRPGPRDLKLALLCFHRYSRMHIHFSLFSRPIAHSATLNTPDGERPTLCTRHLKPASPCFHQHPRMNLHFALFAPPNVQRAPTNILLAAAETWHLTPETYLPFFSSTSPDEPSFLPCFAGPARRGDGNEAETRAPATDTWHPTAALLCFHRYPRMNLRFSMTRHRLVR